MIGVMWVWYYTYQEPLIPWEENQGEKNQCLQNQNHESWVMNKGGWRVHVMKSNTIMNIIFYLWSIDFCYRIRYQTPRYMGPGRVGIKCMKKTQQTSLSQYPKVMGTLVGPGIGTTTRTKGCYQHNIGSQGSQWVLHGNDPKTTINNQEIPLH